MSNCGRFLSCLKIKMPRTRRTSLRTLKTQLSEGSEAKVKFLVSTLFKRPASRQLKEKWGVGEGVLERGWGEARVREKSSV